MNKIKLKVTTSLFLLLLLCSHQISASNGNSSDAIRETEAAELARTMLTPDVNTPTSNVEEFLTKNISEFINARKEFIAHVPETKYEASAVLELLKKSFPDYTFSREDNYLHMGDSLYIGDGQQILTIGKKQYRSQIQYFFYSYERPINAIRLRLIDYRRKKTLCKTISYTENPDSHFLHRGDPDSTINTFREIIAREKEIIAREEEEILTQQTAVVKENPTNETEIPIKESRCCLLRALCCIFMCRTPV